MNIFQTYHLLRITVFLVFFVRKKQALIFVVVFFSDLQKNEKKSWVKKLEHFVETKASTKVLESIKKEQCVMITGPFGSGKSMTVFYVALRLEDVDGFDILFFSYKKNHMSALILMNYLKLCVLIFVTDGQTGRKQYVSPRNL
jgi:type II secretory pathway predicted ATPase ExeA